MPAQARRPGKGLSPIIPDLLTPDASAHDTPHCAGLHNKNRQNLMQNTKIPIDFG